MSQRLPRIAPVIVFALAAAILAWLLAGPASSPGRASAGLPGPQPQAVGYTQVSTSETPPTEQQCFSAVPEGRRCFTPQSFAAAYNLDDLHAQQLNGRGYTIAVVDSYGSDTMAHDLHVFNNAFNLPHMCGEEGVTCQPGMPKFSTLALQGTPATKAPPGTSKSPGQEDKSAWALEVGLDVEWAHAAAPGANIILVTTPTAETLGVQGFPQMMAAEKYVVEHHLADVISQSFGSAEEAFGSTHSLENLRDAFKAAVANDVTVLASSGDTGPVNDRKSPVGQGGSTIPGQTVGWPASDPLVTGVGGTALCTDPTNTTTRVADNVDPPAACQAVQAPEIVWDEPSRGIATGGGFSHVFARPDYQSTLPVGSTPIPSSQRGVPDIAGNASPRTGVLIYVSLPPNDGSGLICPTGPCSTGWYVIGGTSASTPEWAGMVSIADQIAGHRLGFINPALYRLASSPGYYPGGFFDITIGDNHVSDDVAGFPATTGWDPSTGLGTPDAATVLPDLAAAASGSP
jgi:subtilase family serine protease